MRLLVPAIHESPLFTGLLSAAFFWGMGLWFFLTGVVYLEDRNSSILGTERYSAYTGREGLLISLALISGGCYLNTTYYWEFRLRDTPHHWVAVVLSNVSFVLIFVLMFASAYV